MKGVTISWNTAFIPHSGEKKNDVVKSMSLSVFIALC